MVPKSFFPTSICLRNSFLQRVSNYHPVINSDFIF